MPPPAIRCASQNTDLLGESPFWHPVEQCLYWVDIAGKALRRLRPGAADETWPLPEEPGCVAPALSGGLIIALRSRVIHFDPATAADTTLAPAPYDTATSRFNDGRCDPRGRFWSGTVFEPKTAANAALYCLTRAPNGSWSMEHRLGDNVTANGLAFSEDGRRAWWSNTPDHVIYEYDFDAERGELSNQRVFQRFARRAPDAPYGGRPDGVAIDSEGHYWVAMYEGGRVLRFSPHGELRHELLLPVTCPTMVCFGGAGLRTLYVTTASKGRPEAERAREPLAGRVLAIELEQLPLAPGVRGLPAASFDPAA
jgi:sugar lactone lactonase YvrE